MSRKKWRIVYPDSPNCDTFASESRVYAFVDDLRSSWAAGARKGTLTVQVNEGSGWQDYEHIDFAEEAS
jgi:hypothetical protein